MADNDKQLLDNKPRFQVEEARQELESEENEVIAADEGAEIAEDEYTNELALEQAREEDELNQEIAQVSSEGKSFGSPDLIKYFVLLFVLAVPNDAVDAGELTGFLLPLAWWISLFLSVTSILVSWFTDEEQKRAEGYVKKLEALQARVVSITRTAFRVAKFFRKNPTMKIAAGAVAEMIPYISILPWSTIAAIWAYLDERSIYKNARKTGEEVASQTSQSVSELT